MSVNGKRERSGKTGGREIARLFFLEQISVSQIYSGQELKSFSPRRMGFSSLSQISTGAVASSV